MESRKADWLVICGRLFLSSMSFLQVSGIHKRDEKGFHLNNINFELEAFGKLAIAGATGSGKTTLLKIIGGLAQADEGTVLLNGERVRGADEQLIPGHKDIGYLSQHFELRNHYRVEELLDYTNQLPAAQAAALYKLCRVDFLLKRWSTELSGGERQRVALARILTASPQLLLLDEPYSNLDFQHKVVLKEVISDISSQLSITTILVSHDAGDILPWADEIIILKEGNIVERGKPEALYLQPKETYTAGILGKYNLVDEKLLSWLGYTSVKTEKPVILRPEHFVLATIRQADIVAEVTRVQYLGHSIEVSVTVDGNAITVLQPEGVFRVGDTVGLKLSERAKAHPSLRLL